MATVKELQARAAELDVPGRSGMKKPELEKAVAKAESAAASAEVKPDEATPPPVVDEPTPPPVAKKKAKKKAAKVAPALAWLGDVTPTHSGRPVLTAQTLLQAHGYQLGALDGIAGREFTRAVARFRDEHGLPAGDTIDADVWSALAAAPE